MPANPPDVGSRAWLEALASRGRLTVVEVALAAARSALPIWEAKLSDVREPRESIEAIEAWLRDPTLARGRVLVDLAYRRGDPDDIDGWWLVLDDGRQPGRGETDAYCAADYAGNTIYCPVAYMLDPLAAAIGCARSAGVSDAELSARLARAAEVSHEVDYHEYGSLLTRRAPSGEGRIGKPDRSAPPSPCPSCGADGFPIAPKVSVAGVDHQDYRCMACDEMFDRELGASLYLAYSSPKDDG